MAAQGKATAYQCWVQANRLETLPANRLRTDCATVDDAQDRLSRGQTVVVAESDMEMLRRRLAAFEVGV